MRISNASRTIVVTLFPAAMLLSVAGCGKSAEDRITEAAVSAASGQKVSVDHDGDKVTIKTEQGEMQMSAGDGIALPEDFPKDVFLPSGYTVKSAMKLPQATMVQVTAPGRINDLFAQADKQMLAQGWEQTMSMQQAADTRMLGYKKPDRQAMVTLHAQDDGQVQVGLQVSAKQKQ